MCKILQKKKNPNSETLNYKHNKLKCQNATFFPKHRVMGELLFLQKRSFCHNPKLVWNTGIIPTLIQTIRVLGLDTASLNKTQKIFSARLVPLFQSKTGVFKKAKPIFAFGKFKTQLFYKSCVLNF